MDTQNTRADRLRALLRENTGHRRMAAFRRETAAALGRAEPSLEVASLAETDRVRSLFGPARVRAEQHRGEPGYHYLATEDRRELEDYVAGVASEFPATDMFLLRLDTEYCGAVRTNSTELFDRINSLIEFEGGEDLLACSEDASAGIFAAWYDDWGTEVFAFQAWYGAPAPGHCR